MSTATIFQAETPKGFYMQLVKGRVPALADADRPRAEVAVPDVEGGRARSSEVGKALLEPVDDELRGERGEDDAENARDHRFHLGADQPHQRPRGEQGEQRQQR